MGAEFQLVPVVCCPPTGHIRWVNLSSLYPPIGQVRTADGSLLRSLNAEQPQFSLTLLMCSLLQPPDHLGIMNYGKKRCFQNWKQHFSCSIASAEWWGIITVLDLLTMLFLTQPHMLLSVFATHYYCIPGTAQTFSTEPLSTHQPVTGLMASQVLGFALAFGELPWAPISPGTSQAQQLLRTDLIHAK